MKKVLFALLLAIFSLSAISQKIFYDGDSNTRGEFIEPPGYNTGSTENYPNQTKNKFLSYQHQNAGVNYNEAGYITDSSGSYSMYNRYPGMINSNSIYVLIIGINDFGHLKSAAFVWQNVKQIMAYVRSLGCTKIILGTYPPAQSQTGSNNTHRLLYNQMVRDSASFYQYKVADIAGTAEMSTWSLNYWSDHIHWNIAGSALISNLVAAQINSFNPLPLAFTSLHLSCTAKNTTIRWTAHEYNRFVIQKSNDGKAWKTAGETSLDNYTDEDRASFYRLIASNGQKEVYSSVLKNSCAATNQFTGLQTYPNPVNDQVMVSISVANSISTHLDVRDALGRQVQRVPVQLTKGQNQLQLNTENFKPGIYIINCQGQSARIVKH